MTEYATDETPFGSFKVTCECGSKNIELDNSLGYSPESGRWGSIDIHCLDCDKRAEIVSS